MILNASLIVIDPILRILNWEWNGSNFDGFATNQGITCIWGTDYKSPHERERPLINLATTSYSEEESWKVLDIQSRFGGQDYVISRIDFQMPFFRSLWWSSEFQLPFLWRLLYGLIIEVKKDRTSHYTSAFFLGQKIGEFFFSVNLTFKKNLHAWD